MDIVTTLSIIEGLGVIADRAEAASLIGLLEDCPSGILQGINFESVWMIRVGLLRFPGDMPSSPSGPTALNERY
jgi:hypothetical protein